MLEQDLACTVMGALVSGATSRPVTPFPSFLPLYPLCRLTEFSCEDGAAGRPTADHLKFMKDIVPMLDAAPYVYRYAWMSAHDGRGLRGLFDKDANGKTVLTVLGQAYNTL